MRIEFCLRRSKYRFPMKNLKFDSHRDLPLSSVYLIILKKKKKITFTNPPLVPIKPTNTIKLSKSLKKSKKSAPTDLEYKHPKLPSIFYGKRAEPTDFKLISKHILYHTPKCWPDELNLINLTLQLKKYNHTYIFLNRVKVRKSRQRKLILNSLVRIESYKNYANTWFSIIRYSFWYQIVNLKIENLSDREDLMNRLKQKEEARRTMASSMTKIQKTHLK